ncbi:NAD(P)/FAD-dependent oxidoreductase [Cellulomonas sp. C5510]|uniref:phytoene desaturase family protein n=1 Tax=Cellulomonas sp. C5510 TaxID=2871170 RepID=UPI001C9611BF|nr:NAD(P)/FAD-dependent oxidoreductase [Cellulomonas sp. C5510]QZN84687.1 NAD(P)/FAD-dependent oxidoreductase [Cellulomonas sp. C5510]
MSTEHRDLVVPLARGGTRRRPPDAVVVGAGPNGLAAAIECARAGLVVHVVEQSSTIGGGARTSERILPGLLHDDCSAVHPMAAASPFFQDLRDAGLAPEDAGLRLVHPPAPLAHPLDGADAGVLHRDLERTAAGLGADGARWRRRNGPLVARMPDLLTEVMQPLVHLPRHPLLLARFGVPALVPGARRAASYTTPQAAGLAAGLAAHAFTSLDLPGSGAVGALLGALGHSHGWPFAVGGSQSITTALARILLELGGTITTGFRVDHLDDVAGLTGVDPRRGRGTVLLDTSPSAAARILGTDQPRRQRAAYQRFRHGPAAFRVDLAVRDGIPWADPAVAGAGSVHLGGAADEVAAAEGQCWDGGLPERPFVVLAQPHVADDTRSVRLDGHDVHPVWAYAHVPRGFPGDATDLVLAQIERFAPGIRRAVVGTWHRTVPELAAHDPNAVDGDVCGGANDLRQLVARPRALRPYETGVPGVLLCSASTPPGAGVHGMSGANAARVAVSAAALARAGER